MIRVDEADLHRAKLSEHPLVRLLQHVGHLLVGRPVCLHLRWWRDGRLSVDGIDAGGLHLADLHLLALQPETCAVRAFRLQRLPPRPATSIWQVKLMR